MGSKQDAREQMSEAFATAAFLSVSGGLQDAYTYLFRGEVFANAQTGNIVLLAQSLAVRDWLRAAHYLVPLMAFAMGVVVAEVVRDCFRHSERVHWRQVVLAVEICLLLAVGFLPERFDMAANCMVSLACAMQVQAFRKFKGNAFASTMCIGNLRSGMDSLCSFVRTGHAGDLRRAGRYWEIILLFGFGAWMGGRLVEAVGASAIWVSCGLLTVALGLMFVRSGGSVGGGSSRRG